MDGELSATSGSVGGTELVIFWKAGQASALDTGAIDEVATSARSPSLSRS